MYSLYVYDEDLLRQGVVEDIDSLQWLSLYAGAGEVKLVMCGHRQESGPAPAWTQALVHRISPKVL